MIPTLIGITFLVFMLVALAPGGIGAALKAQGGNLQSQSGVAVQQAYLDDRYGLDAPVLAQYARWLGRISPIKFGARDLIAPSGDKARPPKAVKEPPLWRWFADSLPAAPPPAARRAESPIDARIERYRAAERKYADTRGELIAEVALLKEVLKDYVKEAGISGALTRAGEPRLAVIERSSPNRSVPSWSRVERHGAPAVAAYGNALVARAELLAAFEDSPYPRAGFGIAGINIAMPDFGVSFSRGRPVIDLLAAAMPVTLLLNLVAFPIIYLIAIPSGMLAATKRGTWLDSGLGAIFIGLWSFPVVLAGVLAIGYLASNEGLRLFPVGGHHDKDAGAMLFLPVWRNGHFEIGYVLDTLWHITLPVLCLVYGGFAVLSKQTRAAMLENFSADYVRTAKAKGVAPKDVVLRHVFRNSLLPVITMFVTIFPAMLAGSVVIERIFHVPGMGSMIIEAITLRDRELLLADTTLIAGINILALLLADILYALADPRVAYD